VILLFVVCVIGATSGIVYCIKKKGNKTDELAFDSKERMDSDLSEVTPNNASIQQ